MMMTMRKVEGVNLFELMEHHKRKKEEPKKGLNV
jgi:hypothetical protein